MVLRSSRALQECAQRVVAEQCGSEIAGVLGGLADSVRTASKCQSSRLRSTSNLKHRGIEIDQSIRHKNYPISTHGKIDKC